MDLFNFFIIIEILSCTVHSFTVNCDYSFVEYHGHYHEFLHESSYACYANVAYECDHSFDLEGVSKNHMTGKTNADVILFDLENYLKIDVIPKNVGAFFPYIEVFKCSLCTVSQISSSDLMQFPKLKCFYLGHNKLRTIPGDLFKHTPNIEFVGLEFNEIERVGADFFNYLSKLKILYFNNNICSIVHSTALSEVKEQIIQKCLSQRKFSRPDKKNQGKTKNVSRNFQRVDRDQCDITYLMSWPNHSEGPE